MFDVQSLALAAGTFIYTAFALLVRGQTERELIVEEIRKGYEEYESGELLKGIWFDQSTAGVCTVCGCDDSPRLEGQYSAYCKWCLELEGIEQHLESHGIRRITKNQKL